MSRGESFLGREAELGALSRFRESDRSEFVPVYGRRRIGKTELIMRCLRDGPGLYFLGKQAPQASQIREFLRVAAEATGQGLLARVEADDWKTALRLAVEQFHGDRKWVLALDEFPWMAQASPSLPSVLQELWDTEWRGTGRIFLILCGSYMGFMEREVLGARSPLYGRRTGQILLRPFDYRESALFHPGLSLADRAQIHFICGGVPYYLRSFRREESIAQNIRNHVLDPYSPLSREPDFLLREELRDLDNYYGILMAVASGAATQREMAERTGLPERSLHYYLKSLLDLGYLARTYPLIHRRPTVRSVRYVVSDPFLRFWFRFLHPNGSLIAQLPADRAYQQLIAPELASYFGTCFERLCREALGRLYAREGVTAAFEVGEYWDADVQIDVVGRREDDRIDIGECKWGAVRSWPALARELRGKIAAYPNPDNRTIQGRLFVRQAARGTVPDGVVVHDLESLYAD